MPRHYRASSTPTSPALPRSHIAPPGELTSFAASEGYYILREVFRLDSVSAGTSLSCKSGTSVSLVSVKYRDVSHQGLSKSSTSDSKLHDAGLADHPGGSGQVGYESDELDLASAYQTPIQSRRESRDFTTTTTATAQDTSNSNNSSTADVRSRNFGVSESGGPSDSPASSSSHGNGMGSRRGKDKDKEKEKEDETSSFGSLFGSKKRRAKGHIQRTNSTFVAKIVPSDNKSTVDKGVTGLSGTCPSIGAGLTGGSTPDLAIGRRKAEETGPFGQVEETFLFFNVGKSFAWTDFGTVPPKTPLSHINFHKAYPTTHDINLLTRSSDHLDVIIGFSTGDVFWYNHFSQKYCRLNKGGIVSNSPVTCIKWMPGSETLFMTSCADGSIVVYDRDKEDQYFEKEKEREKERERECREKGSVPTVGDSDDGFVVNRSLKSNSKHNPVAHYQIGLLGKSVNAFAFSPDCQHVAIVSADGCLRVVDFVFDRLRDTYTGYFGAITCVCWSPDGKYILTGGQDDLVTIWAFRERNIVARCQGHRSWVTGVAFDPWRCDERNYRFGSVGEDGRLCFWDFSVSALSRPKVTVGQRRSSIPTTGGTGKSNCTLPRRTERDITEMTDENTNSKRHPLLPRSLVAVLQPVMAKAVHGQTITWISFREDSIVTACRKGIVKIWSRPD